MTGTTAPAAQTTAPATDVNAGAPAPADAYDEFSAAFDSLMTSETDDEQTTEQTHPTDNPTGAADNAEQQAQQTDGAGDTGEPAPAGTDAPAGDDKGLQDAAGDDAAGSGAVGENDLAAQLSALQAELAALKAAPPAAAQPAPAPAAAEPKPAEPKPIYSTAEQVEMAELQKEWPDLHRMFTLMSRQVQHETLTYAFSEMERVLTPLQSSVGTLAGNEHMAAIYEAHEDYDQVYQPVMEWIEKQPTFLKAAYQSVVKQGTAQDVNDMIARFKTETQWKAPAAGGTPAAPAKPTATAPAAPELSEAAKKAASAIGAVGTKRSGVPTAKDPLDFDGGWEEATATTK